MLCDLRAETTLGKDNRSSWTYPGDRAAGRTTGAGLYHACQGRPLPASQHGFYGRGGPSPRSRVGVVFTGGAGLAGRVVGRALLGGRGQSPRWAGLYGAYPERVRPRRRLAVPARARGRAAARAREPARIKERPSAGWAASLCPPGAPLARQPAPWASPLPDSRTWRGGRSRGWAQRAASDSARRWPRARPGSRRPGPPGSAAADPCSPPLASLGSRAAAAASPRPIPARAGSPCPIALQVPPLLGLRPITAQSGTRL